jgi:hypothetical protein
MSAELSPTVSMRADALEHLGRFRLRTKVRTDGQLAYEMHDRRTGRVRARSRNFRKVYDYYLARRRGTKGG